MTGGSPSAPVAAAGAVSVTTDGVNVYFGGTDPSSGTGFVSRAPVGNLRGVMGVASQADFVSALFADTIGGNLFYDVAANFGIFQDTLSAPSVTTAGYATSGIPNRIVADASRVYWAIPGSSGVSGVYAQAKGSSGSATTLSSAASVQGLAVQGAFAYYADASGATVSRVPADGSGSPTTMAPASSPVDLVADGSFVYWIDTGGGTIMKVPLAGGTATAVATGQSAVRIAQAGASVYWTNGSKIMRLPK